MDRIKIEDAEVVKRFDELKMLREGLEEALRIFGKRKKEAFDLLKVVYPDIDVAEIHYDTDTNEVMYLTGEHRDKLKGICDA